MKNNLNKIETPIFKELSIKKNIFYGDKLRQIRNLLILKPEDLASVLTVSTNTIKKAEEGGNVGIEVLGEIIMFYGFTIERFYNLEKLPNWKDLNKQIELFHRKNNSESYKILRYRPNLIGLIEHRLLDTDLFKQWVNENQVIEFCKEKYNYDYSSATNTLNNSVAKGWLISNEDLKPKRYKIKDLK